MCCLRGFSEEFIAVFQVKMSQIDAENVDKFSFCRFDAISAHFLRAFVISSNTVKTKQPKAMQYSV